MDSPNVLSLPNEILARILNDPQMKQDQASFRLTCKHFHGLVTSSFAKRDFYSLPIIIGHYSLQALADICAHPVFGSYVREIAFQPWRVHRSDLTGATNEINSCLTSGQVEDLVVARRALRALTDLRCEQFELGQNGSSEHLRLLVLAFEALGRLGNPINVTLSGYDPYSGFLEAIARLRAELDDVHVDPDPYFRTTLRLIILGAYCGHCKLQALDIQHYGYGEYKDPTDVKETPIDVSNLQREISFVLSELKNLVLISDTELTAQTMTPIRLMLAQTKHLQKFHINVLPPENLLEKAHYGDKILKCISTDSLQCLSLEGLSSTSRYLSKLLERNGRTLRDITLGSWNLYHGSWNVVFLCMMDKLPHLH